MGQKLGFGWVVDCARRRDSRVPSRGARLVEGIWAVHLFAAACSVDDDTPENPVLWTKDSDRIIAGKDQRQRLDCFH